NPEGAHPTLVVEIRIGQVEGEHYRVLARSDGLDGAFGDDEGGLAVGEGWLEGALRVEGLVQQVAATADDRRVAEGAGDRFGDAIPLHDPLERLLDEGELHVEHRDMAAGSRVSVVLDRSLQGARRNVDGVGADLQPERVRGGIEAHARAPVGIPDSLPDP